jgi:protein O-mannosyl-transferase
MPAEPASRFHPHALAAAILVVALLATWFAYAPGMGGSTHFDDQSSLGQLRSVTDSATAFRFVTGGSAGPLGRPLALASFVPQAYAWPASTEVLLRTNILIHLLNGVLVTWFLYLLGRSRKQMERQAALIGVGAGAIWMLMPLLASSSLFIVQRMTTLSALFMLLGAVGYLYARNVIDRRPIAALCGMTLALGAGATLGVLAKENGALLFLLVLAAEYTLLDPPSNVSRRLWRTWFSVVLVAPLVVLLVYLASALPYPESVVLRRDFTGLERLITQAEILWKYLYLAFLPNIPSLGPFHDDYAVQRNLLNPVTLLSVGGWIAAVFAAVGLRHKAPLFSFAVAWYVLGHLLESTTLSLELYFEHRNYLPLIGPVYALVASVFSLGLQWRRIAILSITAYSFILGGILYSTTSLWGWPLIAAEMWQIYKPQSKRANVYLAQALEKDYDPYTARRVLQTYLNDNPDAYGVRLYILGISCRLEPDADHGATIRSLKEELTSARFSYFVMNSFAQLTDLVREGRCPGIDDRELYELGDSILANPRFNLPIVHHNVHVLMSRITLENREFEKTMIHIEKALESKYVPETLYLAVGILNLGGRDDLARIFIGEALDRDPPSHPLRALQWKRERAQLAAVLKAIERRDVTQDGTT